jgi:hypothetical protein
MVIIDLNDLQDFLKPSAKKYPKYCSNYNGCPCGCEWGACKEKPNLYVHKLDTNACTNHKRTNLRWKLL